MKLLILLLLPIILIAEDNRMSETVTFGGLINCIAVSNRGEVFVASNRGLYSLARGILSHNPVNAVACSGNGTSIFTISVGAKFQQRDAQGTILHEFQLDLPPDSSRECLYPGLTGEFFLCNMGVHQSSGLWRIVVPEEVYQLYELPQEIRGRRLRGLAWHDDHFWIAKETEQVICEISIDIDAGTLATAAMMPRSLPTSSAIQGFAWHDGNLYIAFQVRDETEIHIYEAEAEPRRDERR